MSESSIPKTTHIDCLPSEILYEIFMENLQLRPEDRYHSGYYSNLNLLCISQVCRHWRQVSLSFGQLWSHLHMSLRFQSKIDNIDEEKDRSSIKLFDSWLERTNGTPLNFTVRLFPEDKESQSTASYFIATLLSQQHRWKDVLFRWDLSEMSPDMNMDLTNMPMLTSLKLSILFNKPNESRGINVNLVRSSGLRYLYLLGPFFPQFNVNPVYTLIERAELNLRSNRINCACLDLLRSAPNLKRLEVNIGPKDYPLPQSNNASTHVVSNLETLILHRYLVGIFLSNVTLPALKHLYHECVPNEPLREPLEVLLNFVRRSMPPLTSLAVTSDLATESTLIHVFRLLPALEYFRFISSTTSKRFFQALTVRNNNASDKDLTNAGGDILCPALGYLDMYFLTIPGDITEWVIAVCDMLVSRWTVLRSFKRARAWECNFDVPTIYNHRGEFQNTIMRHRQVQVRAEGDGTYISGFDL